MAFLKELELCECEIEQAIGTINEMSNYLNNVENTSDYLTRILKQTIKIRDKIANKKYDDLLHNATTFIYQNYSNDEISLNLVASSVNISPSYFSAIFSQEMGMTFIEYLTDVRMNKAKELLMCTNMKTSEIGYDVGYKDAHYFSYLFRKTQNCSPKEIGRSHV